MTTYKTVMRPALEYASSICASCIFDKHYKLQVMQNAALRTATGCTQDTNIQHMHDETFILSIHEHLQLHASQYKQKTSKTPLTQIYNILQHSKVLKNTIFNNKHFHRPHTVTKTDIKQTCAIYIHLLSLGI